MLKKDDKILKFEPSILILNQWAGPLTVELAEHIGEEIGPVALLTGHPDAIARNNADTLKVFAVPPYNRSNYLFRIVSWISYFFKAIIWIYTFSKDIPIIFYTNPPILIWIGPLLNKIRGQQYSLIVHDIYPDILVQLKGISENNLLMRFWRYLNAKAFARASVISTLSEQMGKNISSQMGAESDNIDIDITPPWVDTDFIKPMPKKDNWFAKQHNQVDKLTVMYSGNMGFGHDMETMIEAARELQEHPQIHFMFIGAGPKWQMIEQVLEEDALPNVTLLPWQPEATIPYSLATADISLVSIEAGIEGLMIPSKAIYALAAGSALAVLSNTGGELDDWIREYDCGGTLKPGDVQGLADMIRQLAESSDKLACYQQNARQAGEQKFSRIINTQKLVNKLNSNYVEPQKSIGK